jgi:hypothetical protein
MGGRRLQRVTAWLGLVAFAIQAIVPLLVAAEIGLADQAGTHSIFELCAFGHVHAVDHDGSPPAKSGDRGHGADGAICPICVALHAAPAFTAPILAALPLPSTGSIEPPAIATTDAPRPLALAAYRSRAPPTA